MTAKQKIYLNLLFILAPFLMGAGIDLYVPSLPAITHFFDTTTRAVQLTVGFYVFGYALGQGILGILSDSFGRKKIFLTGTLVYTLVSIIASLSTHIHFLIACRFLQGFTIAGVAVVCRAIAKDCFSGPELSKAMSFISMSWALGPILGPVIGGYLQHYFNWQANFYFFSAYGLILFLFALITLFETHLNRSPFHPVTAAKQIKEVTTHPVFLQLAILAALVYAILIVYNMIAPFLIQVHLKYTAIRYGHFSLLLGVGFFLGSFSNRYIIHYLTPVKIILYSILGALLVSLLMIIFGMLMPLNLFIVLIPTFLLFYFVGLIFPNIMAVNVGLFPHAAGTASALYGTFTSTGTFIISLLATLLKTDSQTSLAGMYFGMLFLGLILIFVGQKIRRMIRN